LVPQDYQMCQRREKKRWVDHSTRKASERKMLIEVVKWEKCQKVHPLGSRIKRYSYLGEVTPFGMRRDSLSIAFLLPRREERNERQ